MESILGIVTICQDEADEFNTPIKWYLESVAHLSTVLGDRLKEIILVDGGSKDNTIDLIKSYQQKAPIKLFERPFDCTREQQNFGLSQLSQEVTHVFTPDADMTWSSNFGEMFKSGWFDPFSFVDFEMYFTARDAYHYFRNWPRGVNMRMHKKGPKWRRKFHVQLEGQHHGLPVCPGVVIFENSCRIKSDKALMWRGERRQICNDDMAAEGAAPGPADRFYGAAHVPDSEIEMLPNSLIPFVLPQTNE